MVKKIEKSQPQSEANVNIGTKLRHCISIQGTETIFFEQECEEKGQSPEVVQQTTVIEGLVVELNS